MCDPTQYNSALFAQDIRNSAYQLPVLAQRYLRRARVLRLEFVKETTEERMARLRCGVQWLVASMAYAVRPRTDEQRFMVLTRVLMADESLKAVMNTVERDLFIPDDWISMFGLLTDELSFSDFGDLSLEIFNPFVGWMESRPPTSTNATAPTLVRSVESIKPPPLFLPSPAANVSNSTKLKRAPPVSPLMAEAQCSKRLKVGDENARPLPDGARNKDVPSLKVVPATPSSVFTKAEPNKAPQTLDALGPAIAFTPALWRVSSSSPLAPQTPRFSSPDKSVPCNDPVPVPPCTPTPPCEKKERKSVSSRSKFTPSRNFSPRTASADESASVTSGKLESSSKSVVTSRPDSMYKTVPKFIPSRTPISSMKSVLSGKSVASSKSNSSSKPVSYVKSVSFNKSVAFSKPISLNKSTSSSKFVPSNKSANSSKSGISSSGAGKSDVSSKSVSSSKPEKSSPLRQSGSNRSSVPQTPQPNCLNLQRRLIIMSPPPRPSKSTHRISGR